LIPHRERAQGWLSDKPEGLAMMGDGRLVLVTDNDAVNGWGSETAFIDLGKYSELLPQAR
jgi:hypothetical protein